MQSRVITSLTRVSRVTDPNHQIRQNHDNDCARMSSCSKFETLSPKYSASVSDAGVALDAHAHTAGSLRSSITYACKNCVSVFRGRPYAHRNIVISVCYSFTVRRLFFVSLFYLCADFDSGFVELPKRVFRYWPRRSRFSSEPYGRWVRCVPERVWSASCARA